MNVGYPARYANSLTSFDPGGTVARRCPRVLHNEARMTRCRPTAQPQTVMCRLGRVAAAVVALALVAVRVGWVEVATPAAAQATALSKEQASAQAAYDKALREFKAILAERRAQLNAKQPLPERPGQALYLARLQVISTYKDLTDAVPARIGRGNKFGVPPAYFDASIEPLVDEYAALFKVMQAPPAMRRSPRRPSRTSPISAGRSRAPRGSTPPPSTRQAASASGFSLPRRTATRTSAMRAPTPTRAACRRAWRRIARGARRGRR